MKKRWTLLSVKYKGVQIGQPSVKTRYVDKGVLSGRVLSVKQVSMYTKEY